MSNLKNEGASIPVGSLPVCLWRLNREGVVQFYNPIAEKNFSKLAKDFSLTFSVQDQEKWRAIVARTFESQTSQTIILKSTFDDKENRYFEWTLSWSPELENFVVVANDVSSLFLKSVYYEKILDAMPDFVLVKTEKSRLHWANKAFQDYYGMSNEQLKEIIDAPFNEPDYTQQYVLDDLWVWTNKKTMIIQCEPVTRFDGVVRKFETIKSPIFDDKGEVVFSVGISRDVTERIEHEERSQHSSKMASLGEMAGGIAHEINNPIAVMMGKARLLRDNFTFNKNMPQEKIIHSLKSIEDYGDRVDKIIKGLRRFSRDGSTDPLVPTSAKEIIEETLSFCRSRFAHQGVELRMAEPWMDQRVVCRPVQISQIILNLLNNALDSVISTRQGENPWVELRVEGKSEFLEFRVLDSGPGVPREIETKIMQPFFTTKPVGQGTGLGLSVSSGIARDHGGSLSLDRATSDSCFLLKIRMNQERTLQA